MLVAAWRMFRRMHNGKKMWKRRGIRLSFFNLFFNLHSRIFFR